MQDIKALYESKLKVNLWIRKWMVIPSCAIAITLLVITLITKSDLALMWLGLSAFNLVNLWSSHEMAKIYKSVLDTYEDSDQQKRVRELNPHRK